MSLDKLLLMPEFSELIAQETKRCQQLHNDGQAIVVSKSPQISLADYRSACQILGRDILNDALLAEQLAYFKERMYEMRELFVSGMSVMLTIFPCDASGVKYNSDELKSNFYFHVLRQEKGSGLYVGYVNSLPTAHALMLPKEIQAECSFAINFQYSPVEHQPHSIDGKDWLDFEQKFTKAFINLRTLLGITNSA